jgi:hypothetical protein
MTTTTLPAHTIRRAVGTIHNGLVAGQPIGADQWDQAVTALAAARTQLGGTPRRLIHRLFLGARSNEPHDLAAIIAALTDYLDTHLPPTPEPPPPVPPDEPPDALVQRDDPGERPRGHQLNLFDP